MQETINERIKHILSTLYNGNVTAMGKATGIKRTTLSSIVGADGNTPGFDVIMKIAEITSPCISMEWLIRGGGEMFLDEKDVMAYNNGSISDGVNSGISGGINDGNHENNAINDFDMVSRLVGLVEAKDKQLSEKDKQINTLLEIIKTK